MDLKQLSASLGLSPTTVSRALNGYSDVSESTRQRVVEAAARFGYQPNMVARRLALGKTDAIGIVYPMEESDLADPRFQEVVSGLTERLGESNIDLLIASARRESELTTYQRLVKGHRVDGLIVARTRRHDERIAYLQKAGFPFVAYGRTGEACDHAWFDFDNVAGTRLAVERLVGLGHRKIGFIHASTDFNFAEQRFLGFLEAMAAHGLEVDSRWVSEDELNQRGGYDAMTAILRQPERPTAVIVDNNLSGRGAVRALLDAGLSLGRSMSVIVYDGVPGDTVPRDLRITAIEQPTAFHAGETLAALILKAISRHPVAETQVLWQPRLAEGTSDGPVPA